MKFRIDKKTSEAISLAATVLFLLAVAVCAVGMPRICRGLIEAKGEMSPRFAVEAGGRALILVLGYLAVFFMAAVGTANLFLLLRVRAGQVFTDKTVALIRLISWCCFPLAVIFGVLGVWFTVSIGVAFMAFFVGVCLRVVKNVIEEATAIKKENDLTV